MWILWEVIIVLTTGCLCFLTVFSLQSLPSSSFLQLQLSCPCKKKPKFYLLTWLVSWAPAASCTFNSELMGRNKRTHYCSPVPQNQFPLLTSLFFAQHQLYSSSTLKALWLLVLFTRKSDRWLDASVRFSRCLMQFVPLSFPFHPHYRLHRSGLSLFLTSCIAFN